MDYLHSSNEDEKVVSFISERVLPLVTSGSKGINWLEVGPGPGTKTAAIKHRIEQMARGRLCSIRMIEPSSLWRDFLDKSCSEVFPRAKISENKFEDYAHLDSDPEDGAHHNFITCLHVLYDASVTEEFMRFLKRRAEAGVAVFACIIVESERSDFFRLRQLLQPFGYVQPMPAVLRLRSLARLLGLKMMEFEVTGQHCEILTEGQQRSWLLPFLVGCTCVEWNGLPADTRTRAAEVVRQFIIEKRRSVLDVPDAAFVIETG